MRRREIDHAAAQAGARDDAATPRLPTLLVALLGGATAWSLHLLASYTLLAYGCTSRWAGTRPALIAISLAALAATIGSGMLALRRWQMARDADRPTDDTWDARMGERTARVSFLMVVGLTLAIVSSIGVVFEAITIFLAPLCEPGVGP
jgi:hypothetical protein